MNNIQIFDNKLFGQLRVTEIDGKPYFVGNDVAKSLGYSRPNEAIAQHCRYTLKHRIPHPQSNDKTIEVLLIPEGDIYRLIIRCKLPNSEKFEKWIFDEVLPSIRENGGYMTPQTMQNIVNNPDMLIQIGMQLKEQQNQISLMQPKVDYYDKVADSVGLFNFRETAKNLGIGQKELINNLLKSKLVYRKYSNGPLTAYADSVKKGLLEVKEKMVNGKPKYQSLITTKGKQYIFELLKKEDKSLIGEKE